MGNRCVECNTPILGGYCQEHEPSWFVYWYHRLDGKWSKLKLRIRGYKKEKVK